MSGLVIFMFLTIFGAILVAVAIGVSVLEAQRQRQLKNVLSALSGGDPEQQYAPVILVDAGDAGGHWARALLSRLNLLELFETHLRQSGLDWSLSSLLVAMVVGGVVGFLIGYLTNVLIFPLLSELGLMAALGSAPYLYVAWKRSQRLAQFEEQFPESLDFIARAMRSGHAFSVSLEMLGEETPEPLGREFRTLFNEQNLGAPLDVALENLAFRVPLLDVRFFVSVVLLQRTTGGNLAEILTRLAYLIRERFRLKGQVRAASAHGRITAGVLTFLPIATVILLRFTAPGYVEGMLKDPDGKYMVVGALLAQLVGYFVMRKIIDIKV